MVSDINRILAGFCLFSLLVFSCGSHDDSSANPSTDPDKTEFTDAFIEPASINDAELLRAAHIFITWSTSHEDSMSGDEANALRIIRNIQSEILSGQATFEEMAFNYSQGTSAADSGVLPEFTRGGITEELYSTISSMEPGEISGIIRTRFGYHLVKRLGG